MNDTLSVADERFGDILVVSHPMLAHVVRLSLRKLDDQIVSEASRATIIIPPDRSYSSHDPINK